MKKVVVWLLLASWASILPAYADASASEDIAGSLEALKRQLSTMQATIDSQNARILQLESRKTYETPQPSAPAQPSSTPQLSENDWQKGIKDNIGDAIPWMKGAKFGGDFRLRYEAFQYSNRVSDSGSTTTSSDRTRNRFRVRLRWGFEKDYGDDWKVGFRLATGSTTDPNSTNQTLGNSGYFTFKNILVDRAYAIYEPNGLKDYGPLKGIKIGAGKFENPFLRYSTTIVWDADVTPEGAFEQANWNLLSTEENKLNVQTTAGQFIVNENAAVDNDAELYGYQGAVNYSTYNFGTDQPVDFNFGASFYDYTNWFQTILAANNTAATSYLRTNSITADDFRVLDLYPEIVFYTHDMPVTLWYDYAVNTANVGTDDFAQTSGNDIHDSDEAWGLGFKVGKAKKKGSWEFNYGYYEIGVNAVVAAFNDSDFGGPGTNGFTNRKGHKFGLGYQLTDSLVVNWTGYVVRSLHPVSSSATLGLGSATDEEVFRSQLDFVYKF